MSDRRTTPQLWVVSELYYPEETSTGHVMTQLAEGLAVHFGVSVLCGQPTYSARGRRAPASEVRHGVHVVRCSGTTLDKDVLPFRLLNIVTLSSSIAWRAWRRVRPGDVVLVVTNPPVSPFLISVVCRLRRAACILVIHDVYPEALVAAGMLAPNGLMVRCLNVLNRRLYGAVSAVGVCGRDMRDLVLRKLRMEDDRRVVLIQNWADALAPGARATNPLLAELGLTDKFVVQYAGNMGRVHGIETLFETARLLADSAGDVHFLFIGSGAKKQWLEQAVADAHLQNVTILGNRPRAEQGVFLNACDVSISAFVSGMTGAGVPSRMCNVMAAGKPMIAAVDNEAEQARVIHEENAGWVVPPGQPAELAAAILEARSNPERLAEMGRNARRAAERRFAYAEAVQAYTRLIERVPHGRI